MITEDEYLTYFLAGALFIFAIYPIVKDFYTESSAIFWKTFLVSALFTIFFVGLGIYLYRRQSS